MSKGDIIGLILSYVYAFGLMFGVEAIGKWSKWPQRVTRKFIHIGAGMWVWGVLYFFDHWYYGIIPFSTFIVLNYIFYRQQSFKAMDTEESTLGTVYFAISITILFVLLWRTEGASDHIALAIAAVMAMTWGDGLASLVGQQWGNHKYERFGSTRSLEGSTAMFIASFVSITLTLWIIPGSTLSPNSIPLASGTLLIIGLISSAVATLAESLSPAGTDNLSVPLLSGATLYLLTMLIS